MVKMNSLNRREFMKTAASATVAAAAGCSTAKTKPVKSFTNTPNIIVVMSDEHNANIMGCYGNPIIRLSGTVGAGASRLSRLAKA